MVLIEIFTPIYNFLFFAAKVHLKQHHLVARQGSGLFDLDIAG